MFSRMPELVDAFVLAIRTAAAGDFHVYDGPFGDERDCVHVGYDGIPQGEYLAGTSEQEWAGLGARKRDEALTVECCLVVVNGDAAVKTARDRAYAVLTVVASAIHPSPSMGIPAPTWAGITSHQLHYRPSANVGLEVWAPFVISVRTRP